MPRTICVPPVVLVHRFARSAPRPSTAGRGATPTLRLVAVYEGPAELVCGEQRWPMRVRLTTSKRGGLTSWGGVLGRPVDMIDVLSQECFVELPDGRRGSVVVTDATHLDGTGPPPFD